MVLRRLALCLALFCGLCATQLPAFVQQYQQRLGGAIDELAAIVARFDSDSAQQNLTESGGLDRLRANPDRFVQQRGEQMQDNVKRLDRLRDARTAFQNDTPVMRLATFATHYDQRVARGAWSAFEPAVPTSIESVVLGMIGFVTGGAAVAIVGRPFRRKRGKTSRAVEAAA